MSAVSFDYVSPTGERASYRSYYLYIDEMGKYSGCPGETMDFMTDLYGVGNFYLSENPFNWAEVAVYAPINGRFLGVWKRCVPEKKTVEAGNCSKCGRRGVFVRTALKCPQCHTILGGF